LPRFAFFFCLPARLHQLTFYFIFVFFFDHLGSDGDLASSVREARLQSRARMVLAQMKKEKRRARNAAMSRPERIRWARYVCFCLLLLLLFWFLGVFFSIFFVLFCFDNMSNPNHSIQGGGQQDVARHGPRAAGRCRAP
jgi:hypothetical protein